MSGDEPYAPATWHGEKVVLDRKIGSLDVNPFVIARELGIAVGSRQVSSGGVSGMLIRVGDEFAIYYASHIENEGFQRFCVAHELGHYFLPGHPEAVFDREGIHRSRAGFASGDKYELEADHFAAGLLMPSHLFVPAMRRAGSGLRAIELLARQCKTSLLATALRWTRCNKEPVAVVVSMGNKIDYCVMSDALKDIQGIDWIKKGAAVPRAAKTFILNQSMERVQAADRIESTCEFQDWFGGTKAREIDEDVVGLGTYGKTLTILYGITAPDDDEDDGDSLTESYTPRFRR